MLVKQLLENDMIHSIEDIYQIDLEKFATLDKQGKKSAENLGRALTRSKDQKFSKLIFGIGIRYVGERTSRILAEHFGNMEALINASYEELESINEIGEKIAQSIVDFFAEQKNLVMIGHLKEAGLNFENQGSVKSDTLSDLTFLVTGSLENFSRIEIKEKI